MSIFQRVPGHQFRQFIERYDAAKIHRRAQPPRRVQQVVAQADLVLASHRPRATHTAELLGAPALALIDPHFREIEFPVDFSRRVPKRFRFSALTWTILALVLWRLGYGTRCESFAIAKQRAQVAVDLLERALGFNANRQDSNIDQLNSSQLLEPPATLGTPHSIVLVAHGGINRLIAKELRDRGWKGPRLPRSQHWGCTTYHQ